MIARALRHLPGIGPSRQETLREVGLDDWFAIAERRRPPPGFGPRAWDTVRQAAESGIRALEREDLGFLVETLAPSDRWRILVGRFDRTVFFDIETAGLEPSDAVTLAVCLDAGGLHCFFNGENLDDLLDYLDAAPLLATFNGTGFDVPRIARHFNVPGLRCPHIDLRWICHHQGLRGGLKHIERMLEVSRPADLEGLDGAGAVALWRLWRDEGRRPARDLLARYCCADVVGLRRVAARITARAAGCGEGTLCAVAPGNAEWRQVDRLYPAGDPAAADLRTRLAAVSSAPGALPSGDGGHDAGAAVPPELRVFKRRRLARRWRATRPGRYDAPVRAGRPEPERE